MTQNELDEVKVPPAVEAARQRLQAAQEAAKAASAAWEAALLDAPQAAQDAAEAAHKAAQGELPESAQLALDVIKLRAQVNAVRALHRRVTISEDWGDEVQCAHCVDGDGNGHHVLGLRRCGRRLPAAGRRCPSRLARPL